MHAFKYLLIGGGMAADAAARGIRQLDPHGTIGLISQESDPPYNRTALSKGLWKGRPLSRINRKTEALGVTLFLERQAVRLDASDHRVSDQTGESYTYEKLLLATGGTPIRLPDASQRVIYYRDLADFRRLQTQVAAGQHFVIIGGGFTGSEMADALNANKKQVTLIFQEEGICARFLPPALSALVNAHFEQKGVRVLSGKQVSRVIERGAQLAVQLAGGEEILADGVVAGLGIRPNLELARQAGLAVDTGILVDEYQRTSHADIYAAGDVASFYASALGKRMRAEHEENANQGGLVAGQNMAGGQVRYDTLPAFYAELFDLKYDAVGELNPAYETLVDWEEPGQTGVVYYLKDERVRGVLLWNKGYKWLQAARELIAAPGPFTSAGLIGRIR